MTTEKQEPKRTGELLNELSAAASELATVAQLVKFGVGSDVDDMFGGSEPRRTIIAIIDAIADLYVQINRTGGSVDPLYDPHASTPVSGLKGLVELLKDVESVNEAHQRKQSMLRGMTNEELGRELLSAGADYFSSWELENEARRRRDADKKPIATDEPGMKIARPAWAK
jgi:hypothetical protein